MKEAVIYARRLVFMLILLSVLGGLSACGGIDNASKTTSTADAAPADNGDAIPVPPALRMAVQKYAGDNIVEVPEMVNDRRSAVIDRINAAIKAFAGNYAPYLDNAPAAGGGWIVIKTYPVMDEKYLQVVMTRQQYPAYASDGDIASFCYDYQEDKQVELAEAVAKDELDTRNPENKLTLTLGGLAPLTIKNFAPAAFLYSQEGDYFFYAVEMAAPEVEPGHLIVTRYPDGSYDRFDSEENVLPLGPLQEQLLTLTPPLSYGR